MNVDCLDSELLPPSLLPPLYISLSVSTQSCSFFLTRLSPPRIFFSPPQGVCVSASACVLACALLTPSSAACPLARLPACLPLRLPGLLARRRRPRRRCINRHLRETITTTDLLQLLVTLSAHHHGRDTTHSAQPVCRLRLHHQADRVQAPQARFPIQRKCTDIFRRIVRGSLS